MRILSKILIAFFLLVTPVTSRANVNLCNNSCQVIWVTYGFEEWYSGAPCHIGNSVWDEIHGWWRVERGQCATVETGCHCNWWANVWGNCPSPVLHYFAESDDFSMSWGGNQGWNTCTPWDGFSQCDFGGDCPNGRMLPWGVWWHDEPVCDLTFTFN
jgi:hypothetical protein